MATVSAPGATAKGRMGWGRLLAINAFWFGNGAHWQPIFVSLVPVGAILVVGERDSPGLIGKVTATGGVFALLVPIIVGYLSDRTRTRWGRRRPWMVGGTVFNVLGLLLMPVAFTPVMLVGFYLLLQASNNVGGAAYSGIIPDVVPEADRGRASGLLGMMNSVGTVIGVGAAYLALAILGDTRAGLFVSYAVIAVIFTATLVITCIGTPEKPLERGPRAPLRIDATRVLFAVCLLGVVVTVLALLLGAMSTPMVALAVLLAVAALISGSRIAAVRDMLRPFRANDFFWTFGTRFLTQMGIFTVLPFMTNYFTDVAGAGDRAGSTAALWLLCVLFAGIAPAVIGGNLSDRWGRRKLFVYLSAGIQAAVASVLLFGLVSSIPILYVLGILYGVGYGTYYAVDWALACDVLPGGAEEAGKEMALWHISLTLPQVVAPGLMGAMLVALNNPGHSVAGLATGHDLGYRVLFAMAALWLLLGTVMVRQIRGVR